MDSRMVVARKCLFKALEGVAYCDGRGRRGRGRVVKTSFDTRRRAGMLAVINHDGPQCPFDLRSIRLAR